MATTDPAATGAGEASQTRHSVVSASLARQRLGAPSLVFFMMSAAAPFTVIAGAITTAYAVTGVTAIPLAFLTVGAVLALFSVGYVAMSRRIVNAGAFYTYISRGLGKPTGVGGALVALVAYNALQIALYGGLGVTLSNLLMAQAGWDVSWWLCALAAWAVVFVLGLLRVDLNGKVLAVLLVAEVVTVLVLDAVYLGNPAGGQIDFATLAPSNFLVPGFGAVLVLAMTGNVGFEQAAVFSEETRDPKRTVSVATYSAIVIIALLYAGSAWAMSVATGAENIVAQAGAKGVGLMFALGSQHLPGMVIDIAHVLFVTSMIAALISFHNAVARYTFALGRERVLPAVFGRTSRMSGAPQVASLAQSTLALAVIVVYAYSGLNPLVKLFFWGGMFGGFGVLCLVTVTSVAVFAYFTRKPSGETLWRRAVAPFLATVVLLAMVYAALSNFAQLLGVTPDSPLRWLLPCVYAVAAGIGILWALTLRASGSRVYNGIGLGAYAAPGQQSGQEPAPAEERS